MGAARSLPYLTKPKHPAEWQIQHLRSRTPTWWIRNFSEKYQEKKKQVCNKLSEGWIMKIWKLESIKNLLPRRSWHQSSVSLFFFLLVLLLLEIYILISARYTHTVFCCCLQTKNKILVTSIWNNVPTHLSSRRIHLLCFFGNRLHSSCKASLTTHKIWKFGWNVNNCTKIDITQ